MQSIIAIHLKQFQLKSNDELPSKFGGRPIFFADHLVNIPFCASCKAQLVFLCQISAPLEVPGCYNRGLYVFVCLKCQFQGRVMRVNTDRCLRVQQRKWPCLQKEYGVETEQFDSYPKYQLEDLPSDEEDEEQCSADQTLQKDLVDTPQIKHADPRFQQFYSQLSDMDNPVAIYATQPLAIQTNLPRQPHCLHCNAPAKFQFQLNSPLLGYFNQLTEKQWGVMMVFSCRESCGGECSREQILVMADESGCIKKMSKKTKSRRKKKGGKQSEKEEQKQPQQQEQQGQQGKGDWD